MTKVQKLQLKASELRSQINTELDLPEDERAVETLENLNTAMQRNETELRSALLVEQDTRVPDVVESAQGREVSGLRQRSSLGGYVNLLMGEQSGGAEVELRSALLGDGAGGGSMPLEMLISADEFDQHYSARPELRAVTPVAAGAISEGTQATIAARVFSRSVAARLQIPMPNVSVGSQGYPVLTAGTTVSNQSPSGEQLATAGTFSGEELSPIRATGSYEIRKEDMYRLSGLEEAIRNDLRGAISDHLDAQMLTGNGTAPNVQGITSAVTATPGTDPADTDDFTEIMIRFLELVDGKFATMASELQLVMSAGTYAHAITQYRGGSTNISAYGQLMSEVGGIMVSDRLPVAASDISHTVVLKGAYPERSAAMPIWSAGEMVVDPYALAQSGIIRITVVTMFNFKVLATDAWAVRKVHD